MKRRQRIQRVALALAMVWLGGCRKAAIPTAPSLAPSHNVYLRTGFDTDPSPYLGRFLPEGLAELDESSGMQLACSEHISWRYVKAGGVQTTEVLHTSLDTRAGLGMAGVGAVSAGVEHTRAVRVSYTLTGKMVSTIDDPAAFDACCKAQPDQCTTRMLGEFLQGTGSVDVEVARGSGVDAEALSLVRPVSAGVHVADGVAWRRAVVFSEPVYFAFKATPTPYEQRAVRTCDGFAEPLPVSDDGLYLRATSGPAWTESGARAHAREARSEPALVSAGLGDVRGAAAPGIHEQDWCVERYVEDGATWYAAHVLGFVREADRVDARARADAEAAAKAEATPSVAAVVDQLRTARVEQPASSVAQADVAASCPEWTETPPVSDHGVFVVGRSMLPAVTRQGARLKAVAHAHLQAGLATGLGTVALANGTTIGVQERDWCVVPTRVAGVGLFQAHVLAFVSEQEQDRLRALPQPTGLGVPLASPTTPSALDPSRSAL